MQIRLQRLDSNLRLPEYASSGACAFDIYSRLTLTIQPQETAFIPSNLIIEVPTGHVLILAARSSLFKKKGLVLRNGIGVIDQDFHGPDDEIKLIVQNLTAEATTVERGERIAQGLVMPVITAQWLETDLEAPSRGGFGATGGYQ